MKKKQANEVAADVRTSGRKSLSGGGPSPSVHVVMPRALHREVQRSGAARGETFSDAIRRLVAVGLLEEMRRGVLRGGA